MAARAGGAGRRGTQGLQSRPDSGVGEPVAQGWGDKIPFNFEGGCCLSVEFGGPTLRFNVSQLSLGRGLPWCPIFLFLFVRSCSWYVLKRLKNTNLDAEFFEFGAGGEGNGLIPPG